MDRARRSTLGFGIVIIVLGLFFLARQIFPEFLGWNGPFTWPVSVVGVGVFLLFLGVLTGNPGMAVPACIMGGIGLLLYWQNLTGNWASWAYAWTLIPGFAGVGVILEGIFEGIFTGRLGKVKGGGWSILVSLIMFAIFASFLGGPQLVGQYWPALLILLGVIVLMQYFIQPRRVTAPHLQSKVAPEVVVNEGSEFITKVAGVNPQKEKSLISGEWEYKDFHFDFPHGEVGWVSADYYTEPAARLHYWQAIQQVVMPDLKKWFDEGWEPITEVGPSCVELRLFNGPWSETQNWLAHVIMIVISVGLWLIILAFASVLGKGES